jgi:hypothetical protein
MNSHRTSFYFVTASLIAAIVFIVVQQIKIQRLTKEVAALRSDSDNAKQLLAENTRLASELKALAERTDAEHRELLRLRGQSPALRDKEQEIARLKADRERIKQLLQSATRPADQPAPAEEPQPEMTPERRHRMARLSFSKHIGLELIMFANDHERQLPTNLDAIDTKKLNDMPEHVAQNVQAVQFELTYKGKLDGLKNPGETVLAREKEPMQGPDGKWSQTYVFADGHAEISSAPTKEEMVRRDLQRLLQPVLPPANP